MFIKVEYGVSDGDLWVRGTVEPENFSALSQLDVMKIVRKHFGSASGVVNKEHHQVFIAITLKSLRRKWNRKGYPEIAHGILEVLRKTAKKHWR